MNDLKQIFAFGWPYLKRYWARLTAGIVLGILFGLSNASFVWATQTLFARLGTPRSLQVDVTSNAVVRVAVSTNYVPSLTTSAAGETELKVSSDTVLQVMVKTNVLKSAGPPSAMAQFRTRAAERIQHIGRTVDHWLDPWLPLRGRHPDWKQILGGMLLIPILVAFRGYIGYLSSYCMAWVSERVVRDLRIDLLEKLNSLSMDYWNRSTIGEVMARVNGDTGALYRCLSLGFSDLIKEPITVIGLLVSLFIVSWKLTLLAVVFTPIAVVPIRILGKKARKAVTSTISVGSSQDSLLVEVYSNIRVVKAFCLEQLQMRRFHAIYNQLVRIGMKGVQARELVNPTVELISTLGLGVVIIFIFYTGITVPKLVGFLTGVTLLFTPLKKLGGLHVYFQQASVGANRLISFFKEQPSVKEKVDAVQLQAFTRELRFENVSFSYKPKIPVLREFNLVLPRGVKLGIAGESGSGKSTLVNLLLRFYDPTQGRILIDGVEMRDVAVPDLRRLMALVSQEVVIFDQSVADNIACGREGATRAEVEAAARAAFAHEFIMKLPQGYDTRVGESGKTLSGGQRQRISIARAFVRNAPILILDEATAQLDPKAEAEVQLAIDKLAENRTVICIAHRLSTLSQMDHILVLKDGKIVEQDSFPKLLKANGVFSQMARKQGITLAA